MVNHYADLHTCNTSIERAIEEDIAPELPICTPDVYSDVAISDLECGESDHEDKSTCSTSDKRSI